MENDFERRKVDITFFTRTMIHILSLCKFMLMNIIFTAIDESLYEEFSKINVERMKQADDGINIHQTKYVKKLLRSSSLMIIKSDIMFSIYLCSCFQVDPRESHVTIVKCIFKYLNGTTNFLSRMWDCDNLEQCFVGSRC
ncbi:hypothetical protein CR513_58720, partial [Mucuna pruriens]